MKMRTVYINRLWGIILLLMDFIINQKLDSAAKLYELYGINEAGSLHGQTCEQGHRHFDPLSGLVKAVDPENGRRHMRLLAPF